MRNAALPLEFLDRVACFETLRAYSGKIFCLEQHLDRLSDSCEGMGKSLPFKKEALGRWVKQALKESACPGARLRLSVHWNGAGEGFLLLMIWEFQRHPNTWYEGGVSLATTTVKRWTLRAQDPQIKSSTFVSGVMALLDQGERQAHELIFLNQSGYISEGTVSNILMIKGKCLLTPGVSSGILRGVTRNVVMELALKRDLEVRETFLSRHELYNADECFMTNTSSEVLPVISVDGRIIGDGKPGPWTKILANDFKAHVQKILRKGAV